MNKQDEYESFVSEIFTKLKMGEFVPIYRIYHRNIEIMVILSKLESSNFKCEIFVTNPISDKISPESKINSLLNAKLQKNIPFCEQITDQANMSIVTDGILRYIIGIKNRKSVIFLDKGGINFTDIDTYNRMIKSEKFFDSYEEKCWICLENVSQYELTGICIHPIHYLCFIEFILNSVQENKNLECGICKIRIMTRTESGIWL